MAKPSIPILPHLTDIAIARFWGYVDIKSSSECWLWRGPMKGTRYGALWINRVAHAPHRVSYAIANGADPGELHVCHKCDVPLCCNPSHLFAGTHQDNMDDMNRKGRRRGTVGSKRTPEQRAKMSKSAKARGVSPETIEKMLLAAKGRKQTPEEIERRAAANRGKKRTPDQVERQAAARRGKKWSDEARARVSAKRKGRKPSAEHLANVRAAMEKRRGIPMSPEAIAKRVASRLSNKLSRQKGE